MHKNLPFPPSLTLFLSLCLRPQPRPHWAQVQLPKLWSRMRPSKQNRSEVNKTQLNSKAPKPKTSFGFWKEPRADAAATAAAARGVRLCLARELYSNST